MKTIKANKFWAGKEWGLPMIAKKINADQIRHGVKFPFTTSKQPLKKGP